MKKINEIEEIIKNGSTRIDDYLALGDLYFGIGKFEKIIDLYSKVLTLKLPIYSLLLMTPKRKSL